MTVVGWLYGCDLPDEEEVDVQPGQVDPCGSTSTDGAAQEWQPLALPVPTTVTHIADAIDIPGLLHQTSARGRSIAMLEPVGPQIYLGYGDYRGNTGPIELIHFDTDQQRFVNAGPLATEEIVDLRHWSGRLWIPNVDPIAHAGDGSVFVTSDDCRDWRELPAIPGGVHIFDAQVHGHEMLLATGSLTGAPAKVVAVGENEQFREFRQLPARADAYLRYEHIESLGSALVLSARIFAAQTHSQLEFYDGEVWHIVPGPASAGTLVPVAQTGGPEVGVCWAEFDGDPGKSGLHRRSWLFDGHRLTPRQLLPTGHRLLNWYRGQVTTARYVWALTEDAQSLRWLLIANESDACTGKWPIITPLPVQFQASHTELQGAPSAITWQANVLYIGTTQGQLWSIATQHRPSTYLKHDANERLLTHHSTQGERAIGR